MRQLGQGQIANGKDSRLVDGPAARGLGLVAEVIWDAANSTSADLGFRLSARLYSRAVAHKLSG